MMRKIKIYYGLSGTFKGTTISTLGIPVLETAIKRWKTYEEGIFAGKMNPCDINFGILHLIRLQDFLGGWTESDIAIERGISDCLFYYYNNDEYGDTPPLDDCFVRKAVGEEGRLLENNCAVTRTLLIQRDVDFISSVILKEPHRNKTFRGSPEYYLEQQQKYVDWTTKYNQIDVVEEIDNARKYIESLGLKYDHDYCN